MLTSVYSRAQCVIALLFAFAIACMGMLPGTAWATDAGLAAGTPVSQNNGIPVLTLTTDPDEFQQVVESPDHSYHAECGSISIDVPDGYTGEFSETELSDIEDAALE